MPLFGSAFGQGMKMAFKQTGQKAGMALRYLWAPSAGKGLAESFGNIGNIGRALRSDWEGIKNNSSGLSRRLATKAGANIKNLQNTIRPTELVSREYTTGLQYELRNRISANPWAGITAKERNLSRQNFSSNLHSELQKAAGADPTKINMDEIAANVLSNNRHLLSKEAVSWTEQNLAKDARNSTVSVLNRNILQRTSRAISKGTMNVGTAMKQSYQSWSKAQQQANKSSELLMGNLVGKSLMLGVPSLATPIMMYRVSRGKPTKGGLPIVPLI